MIDRSLGREQVQFKTGLDVATASRLARLYLLRDPSLLLRHSLILIHNVELRVDLARGSCPSQDAHHCNLLQDFGVIDEQKVLDLLVEEVLTATARAAGPRRRGAAEEAVDEVLELWYVALGDTCVEQAIVVKPPQQLIVWIPSVEMVEQFLKLEQVPLHLVLAIEVSGHLAASLTQNSALVFRLDGHDELVVVCLDLVFELNAKLEVGVLEAARRTIATVAVVSVRTTAADERQASLFVKLEFYAWPLRANPTVLYGLDPLVVQLQTAQRRQTQQQQRRQQLNSGAWILMSREGSKHAQGQRKDPEHWLRVPNV